MLTSSGWAVECEQKRRELEGRRRTRPVTGPPDDEHVWLSTTEAALVLGLSQSGVRYRAVEVLLPCKRSGSRVWFRRDHAE